MRYKRRKAAVSKYVSHTSDASVKGSTRAGIRRRAVASGVIIITLFSLTRVGFIERNALNAIITSTFSKDEATDFVKNESAKNFIDKIGALTAEFCFGYLRSRGESDSTAYAKSVKTESDDVEEMEISVNSDAAEDSEVGGESVSGGFKIAQPVFAPVLPCAGNVSSGFGERIHPVTGEVKNHNGVDIACNEGESVRAVFDGVVEKAEYNEYSGNFAVVRHIDGFTSSYAHLSELLVTAGQSVTTGDEIGKTGSTGMVTGPHLHFEIRQNGNAVNPFDYISGD